MDNHVALGMHKCTVCTKDFESGEVLLATKYHPRPARFGGGMQPMPPFKSKHVVTGWGICPVCQGKIDGTDDGKGPRVALIGCDPDKSQRSVEKDGQETVTPEEAYRTGRIAFIRRDYLRTLTDAGGDSPILFVDDEVISFMERQAGLPQQKGEQS